MLTVSPDTGFESVCYNFSQLLWHISQIWNNIIKGFNFVSHKMYLLQNRLISDGKQGIKQRFLCCYTFYVRFYDQRFSSTSQLMSFLAVLQEKNLLTCLTNPLQTLMSSHASSMAGTFQCVSPIIHFPSQHREKFSISLRNGEDGVLSLCNLVVLNQYMCCTLMTDICDLVNQER